MPKRAHHQISTQTRRKDIMSGKGLITSFVLALVLMCGLGCPGQGYGVPYSRSVPDSARLTRAQALRMLAELTIHSDCTLHGTVLQDSHGGKYDLDEIDRVRCGEKGGYGNWHVWINSGKAGLFGFSWLPICGFFGDEKQHCMRMTQVIDDYIKGTGTGGGSAGSSGGCTSDSQCKGDRICEQGRCVNP